MDKALYSKDGDHWLGLNTAFRVDHREWLSGAGKVPADVMFVGGSPGRMEAASRSVTNGDMGRTLLRGLDDAGIDSRQCYYTYAVKYNLGSNKLAARDVKACADYLNEEIRRVKPKIIVCMGKDALEAVCGKEYKFSVVRSTPVPYPGYDTITIEPGAVKIKKDGTRVQGKDRTVTEHHDVEATVYAVFNPAYLDAAPREADAFAKELKGLKLLMEGKQPDLAPFKEKVVCTSKAAEVEMIADALLEASNGQEIAVSLDCEWHGESWYDADGMLRTVQLGLEDGTAFVIEFTSSKETVLGYEMYQAMDNPVKAWAALKRLLEDPLVKIVGQNVKEDGLWLMNHGIDIRPNVVWDTMLAESLLNQAGPFGLEELALKYTDIPRWSLELEQWKKEAGGLWHRGGYGFVPPSILNPYAGLDVIATMAVFMKQAAMIEMEEYMEPRGQYPSLFKSVMNLQNALYEIERTGLPVDTEMLDKMIGLFEPKVDKMRDAIIAEAVKLGCSPDFNPGSSDDVTDLLFKRLGITPFKSTKATGGKLWQDAIRNLSVDEVDAIECIGASTDAISLTILADKHALVQKLLDYNRVSQIRKTWLRTPELDGTGGLYGVLGPDKRLHPSLSLLTQTGRLRSARPNSQNFPKKAQKFLDDIFREELETLPWLKDYGGVPSVRQIVVPPEGWVIMEADFIQAELFTMAALSNDDRMWATLTTPGMDLHDKTAIDGFGLEILDADGHPLKQERILDQAADFWKQFGGGTTDFKKKLYEDALDSVLGKLTYVEQSGNKMSRKEFKKSLRVSAKAINFGSASKR